MAYDDFITFIQNEIKKSLIQGDTAQSLRQRIKEQLSGHYKIEIDQLRTYDFTLVNQVDGISWFFLLLIFNPSETHKDCDGLLFVSTGITFSSKVITYFEGGTPSQTISNVLSPARIKIYSFGQPMEVIQKGKIETI